MGFWSWLFGRKKEENIEAPVEENFSAGAREESEGKKGYIGKKPKYEKVPRTKEMKDYANSIVKKSENRDSKPSPYSQNQVDREKAEKYVDKIQGRS